MSEGGKGSKKRNVAAMAAAAAPAAPARPPKRPLLDTSRVAQKLWLVKVPVAVAEAIKAASEGQKVGTLTVTKTTGPGGEHRTDAVRLEDALCEEGELPRDYTLEAPPQGAKMPRMYAIRHPDDSGAIKHTGRDSLRVEGMVSRRTSLLPIASLDYRAFAKNRLIQAHKKDRRLVKLDGVPTLKSAAQDRSKDINFSEDAKVSKSSSARRGRLEPEEARTEVFKLFEEKQAWTFKEISNRLGADSATIKSVLKVIADYHKDGPFRSKYTLKQAYGGKAMAPEQPPPS